MAENRTFTLVGKFDDQITPSLKKLNRTFAAFEKVINRGMGRSFRELNKDLRSFAKDLDSIGDIFDRKASRGLNKFRDGIKAASEDARVLGKNLGDASQVGDNFGAGMKDGIRAAQGEAKVLGEILKANALIKVGEGVGNAMSVGARSTIGILSKGMGFVGKQFSAAVKDELEDMQARGSLFGSLKKQGVFKGTTVEEDTRDYRQTKRISRINEEVIGNIVRESPVSTATVSTLNRQLTDNLLPLMLKSRGINNLGTQSEADLEKTFKGTKEQPGVGVELAKLYEQMATLMPSPQYARMGAMGFTQAITSGTINRQLAIFEGNPVLVEALKTIDGGIAATSDIGKRVQIIKKALEIASPTMMLDEMRMSVAGGMQAIQDTLTNPSVGILSMAMEVQGQGEKTLADFGKVQGKVVKNSAYALKLADFDAKQEERKAEMLKRGGSLQTIELQQQKQRKEYIEKLDDILKNANSPLERIAVSLSPVLQSISGLLNAVGSVFMGPVNAAMKSLDIVFAQLQINLDNIASKLRAGGYTGAEGIGRLFAEIVKSIATLFDPSGLGGEAGTAIDKMFADFMRGFNSDKLNGSKYLDMVIKGIQTMIMKLLFTEGDMTKGLTPLGDGLGKIFLLLSAPAFVNALIAGLVPMAIQGMGGMMLGTLTGLGPKIGKANAAKEAAKIATAQKAAAAARTASFGSMALGAAPVAAAGAAGGGGAAAAAGGLASIPVVGWVAALAATVVIFEGPIMALTNTLQDIGKKMQESSNWLTSSFGQVTQGIGQLFGGVTQFFSGLWEVVSGLFSGDADRVVAGIKKLFTGIGNIFVGIGRMVGGLGGVVIGAIGNLFNTVGELLRRAANYIDFLNIIPDERPAKGSQSRWNPQTKRTEVLTPTGWVPAAATGSLGDAISSEMRNKPSGSRLVIANSSETIIPAAGGNGGGMVDFVRTMYSGFTSVVAALNKVQQAQETSLGQINQTLVVNQRQTNTRLEKLETKFSVPGIGSVGGVDSFTPMARGHGLTMTSGNRPGDKGWHGVNRARDYSNGTGPTPQMMAFARFLASSYGSNLKELIYTPLGFSIKNGQRVPPYARAGHYNHVHVAYAGGPGMPAFFSSREKAEDWENKATLGNVKVSSITSNSSEGMGAGVTVNAPITITQLPGQSSEQLASLVAMELANAIRQARSSSMYV
jgi:hypothetical protein